MAFLCITQLIRIQIVDGEMYAAQNQTYLEATQSVQASRGQIFDKNGVLLNTNKTVYKVIVQKAFFTAGSENDIIARTIDILIENNEEWIDEVPITLSMPLSFTNVSDDELDRFKQNIVLNIDATVENCISALNSRYNIDTEKYDLQHQRYIAGVRYQMENKDFSYNNRYTFAEDISINTVIKLKELNFLLSGIDIIEEPVRVYMRGETAAHIRGTIGAISAEQYAELKDKGYGMSDTLGISGIERALENVLRGENGIRTILRDSSGSAISDEITKTVVPGNSVKLTIDSDMQDTMQTVLENQINWLHYNNDPLRGNTCDAGAVVVLDVKTGAVLSMNTYPTYSLDDYIEDYSSVLNAEGAPLNNRAINGLYRPGSAFKTITATTGLINGFIDRNSTFNCTGTYTFYDDYQPKCTGIHPNYSIVNALRVSCNLFFYDLGRRLGIGTLSEYAQKFGYGTDLGLEIGGAAGRMTTPEIYEQLLGTPWTAGDTLQASIGQSETLVTPLHLAVQAMTLANGGVRYQPHLVDSIWNYDGTELISQTEPTIAEIIDDNGTGAFDIVREGMIAVATNCTWPIGTTNNIFDNLPYSVAIKTGTAQNDASSNLYTSTVMGFYPAEDPQIAFGIVLEKGEFSRYMVRNIIDAYFYEYVPDSDEEGNIISPWKRWNALDGSRSDEEISATE